MTSENYSEDLHQGRGWLNRAAEMLDGQEHAMSAEGFARAAAMVGNGFIQLAAVERTTAWRAEDLARWTADREAERENDEVVREVNLLVLARERGEVALVEQRTEALAALDVAGLAASGRREKRAAAEARPRDDEPLHAVDDGVVWVVADANGPIHGAASQTSAQVWASDNADDYGRLTVTALAVDRG